MATCTRRRSLEMQPQTPPCSHEEFTPREEVLVSYSWHDTLCATFCFPRHLLFSCCSFTKPVKLAEDEIYAIQWSLEILDDKSKDLIRRLHAILTLLSLIPKIEKEDLSFRQYFCLPWRTAVIPQEPKNSLRLKSLSALRQALCTLPLEIVNILQHQLPSSSEKKLCQLLHTTYDFKMVTDIVKTALFSSPRYLIYTFRIKLRNYSEDFDQIQRDVITILENSITPTEFDTFGNWNLKDAFQFSVWGLLTPLYRIKIQNYVNANNVEMNLSLRTLFLGTDDNV